MAPQTQGTRRPSSARASLLGHARADQIIIGMRDDAFRWLWCALVVPVRACHVEGRRVRE